jgi:hypothetical protein
MADWVPENSMVVLPVPVPELKLNPLVVERVTVPCVAVTSTSSQLEPTDSWFPLAGLKMRGVFKVVV